MVLTKSEKQNMVNYVVNAVDNTGKYTLVKEFPLGLHYKDNETNRNYFNSQNCVI